MAIINSAQSGNFTATSTWVGGVVPTVGDVATVLASHVVTINSAVTCDEVTNANNTGYFDLVDGGVLNANVTGGATVVNQGVVRASMTTSATINGNVTLVNTANTTNILLTGAGTLTINGNVTLLSGSASSRFAVYSNTANTKLTLNGNANAFGASSSSHAVAFDVSSSNAVINITGTASGGTGGSRGILAVGAGTSFTFSGTAASTGNGEGIEVSSANGTVVASGTFRSTSQSSVGASFVAGTVTVNNAVLEANSNGQGALSVASTVSGTVNVQSISLVSNGCALVVSGVNVTVNAPNGFTSSQSTTTTNNRALRASASTGQSVVINADITAQGGPGAILSTTGNGTITVNGNVYGNNTVAAIVQPGIIVGATGAELAYNTTTRVRVNGNCVAAQYGPGAAGFGTIILDGDSVAHVQGFVGSAVSRTFIVDNTTYSEQVVEYNGLDVLNNFNNGTISTLVDNTTGYPVAADVRQGVSYAASTLTGTLAVPPTASVASGVPVDNTVGTAALSMSDLAAVVGAQIAGALDA